MKHELIDKLSGLIAWVGTFLEMNDYGEPITEEGIEQAKREMQDFFRLAEYPVKDGEGTDDYLSDQSDVRKALETILDGTTTPTAASGPPPSK